MNNKGFISVTVIYSFFLVFLSLMVLIIASTATNRNSLNKMKDTIKEDIKKQIKRIQMKSSKVIKHSQII